MTTIAELSSQNVEAQKHLYLQRVNRFYDNLQDWLKDEDLVFDIQPTEIYETLGNYVVPYLSIQTSSGELLAKMKPAGAAVIMAEGVIEVVGFDNDYLEYQLVGGPTTTDSSGITRPFYQGIDIEGWYWNHHLKKNPILIADKTALLELITWVSDYEFV